MLVNDLPKCHLRVLWKVFVEHPVAEPKFVEYRLALDLAKVPGRYAIFQDDLASQVNPLFFVVALALS